jgi:hypothetical protein
MLLVGVVVGVRMYQRERDARIQAELSLKEQTALNDSTAARFALADVERQALKQQLQTANQLNGKLVAALTIAIAKRDTVVVHDTITTIVHEDGTRTGTFRDSTFAGVIDAIVTAPPTPAPLGVKYTITRPAFSPHIGFVQIGDSVVKRMVRPLPLFGGYVEANALAGIGSQTFGLELRGAGVIRLGWWRVQAGIRQDLNTDLEFGSVFLGVRKEF